VHSHPDQPVRHSYPLAIQDAGLGTALSLFVQTFSYALVRFGVLLAVSVATLVWWVVTLGGGAWIGKHVPLLGWVWMLGGFGLWGYLWWFVARYGLYLLKAGQIAVLTELITSGRVQNGGENMFAYGTRVVKQRFGEVNALFALDMLVRGVVRAFNRTLDWITRLLPIPGLASLGQLVSSVVAAATTYIDETIFSYNLARGDDNPWRSSQDGLIYYAQNAEEVLKTGAFIVVLDWFLTLLAWLACLVPAGMVAWFLPPGGLGQAFVIFGAILVAMNVRAAFLRPLFLIMVMVKFHVSVRGQAIDLTWDQRLSGVSSKFGELGRRAAQHGTAGGFRPAQQPL
jgi:hypothetical protein